MYSGYIIHKNGKYAWQQLSCIFKHPTLKSLRRRNISISVEKLENLTKRNWFTSDHTLILRWWILPKISQSTSALDPASRKCSPYIWPGSSETPWRIINHIDRFRCVDCFRKRMPRASKEGNSNSTSLEALKKSSSPNREDGNKKASAESTMVWNSNSKGKYSAISINSQYAILKVQKVYKCWNLLYGIIVPC